MDAKQEPAGGGSTPGNGAAKSRGRDGAGLWRLVGLVLMGFAALAVGSFVWKSDVLTRELNDHYARSIARAAREVDLRLETHRRVLGNLTELAPLSAPPDRASSSGAGEVDSDPARRKVLPSYRDVVTRCAEQAADDDASEDPESDKELCIARNVLGHSETSGERGALDIVRCTATGDDSIELQADGRSLQLSPSHSEATLDVCGQVNINQLLAHLAVSPSETEVTNPPRSFDEVVLIDEHGKVLAGLEDGSTHRMASLPKFDKARAIAAHVLVDVPLGSREYSVYLEPLALSLTARDGSATGQGKDAGSGQLLLAGLVDEDRLFSEQLEVEPDTFLWALVLLGLVVLALPMTKIWLMGPMSRLRRFDVALLVTSAGATTLLGVLTCLSTTSFFALKKSMDTEIEGVSSALHERLKERLARATVFLDAYEGETLRLRNVLPKEAAQTEPDGTLRHQPKAGAPTDFEEACTGSQGAPVWVQFKGDRAARLACEQVRWPFTLDESGKRNSATSSSHAFLADAAGRQRVKAALGAHATTPVSIAARGYFRHAMDTTCLSGECRKATQAEVVRSATTGNLTLVVVRPFWESATANKPSGVIGVAIEIPEFRMPVLPLGFQTAVIDGAGRVMLHSDNRAFQGHRFFDDLADDAMLRAAVATGEPTHVAFRYLGERSRAYVQRVNGGDWSVVVMAPYRLIDLVLSRTALITLLGFAMVTALALGAFGVLLLLARVQRPEGASERDSRLSLRPDAAARAEYQDATRVLLALAPLPALLATFFPCGIFTPCALGLCAFVALAGVMRVPGIGRRGALASLRPCEEPGPARTAGEVLGKGYRRVLLWWFGTAVAPAPARLWSLEHAFGRCCFALSCTLVAMPTWVIFAAAHDHMAESLARAEQQHLAGSVTPLDCLTLNPTLTLSASTIDPRAECRKVYLASPASSANLVPNAVDTLSASFGLNRGGNSLFRWIQDWLPQFEPTRGTHAELIVLAKAPPDPSGIPWSWHREMHVLHLVHSKTPPLGTRVALLSTALPHLWDGLWLTCFLPLFALGLAGYAGYRLSLSVQWRMFHLRVLKALGSHGAEEIAARLRSRRALFILSGVDIEIQEAVRESVPEAQWLALSDGCTVDEAERTLATHAAAPHLVVTVADDPFQRPPLEALAWSRLFREFRVAKMARRVHEDLAPQVSPKRPALDRIWAECDDDERRVLSQIALDTFANPHPATAAILERLARRGLIDCATLDIPSRAFDNYVNTKLTTTELSAWNESEKGGSWSTMRGVLVAVAAGLTAILTAIQPSFAAAGATVPALVAAVPTVIRLLSLLGGAETAK